MTGLSMVLRARKQIDETLHSRLRPVSIRITFYAQTQATSQTGTAFLFSEMSPACFRPAFDGIQEAWLDCKQDSGGAPSLGYPSKWADPRMPLPESATIRRACDVNPKLSGTGQPALVSAQG